MECKSAFQKSSESKYPIEKNKRGLLLSCLKKRVNTIKREKGFGILEHKKLLNHQISYQEE